MGQERQAGMKSSIYGSNFRRVLALPALAIAVAGTPVRADTGDQAGIAAAVRGQVRQVSSRAPTSVGRVVSSGDQIFLGDQIESGDKAGMQILLMDQTVFTIGPNAALVIDEFIYDPKTDTGKLTAKIVKGAFRFVSGRIAGRDAKSVTLRTPVASIGVRGTTVIGWTDDQRSEIILTSVGPNNNTGDRPSRILVTANDVTRTVHRTGFGVTVPGPGQPPAAPARAPAERINAISGSLAGPPRPSPTPPAGPGGSGTQSAAFGELTTQEVTTNLVEDSGQTTAAALDPAATETEVATLIAATEAATIQDTVQAPGGIIRFPAVTVVMTPASAESATYTFDYKLDFSNRTFAGNVKIDAITGFTSNGTGNFPLLVDPYVTNFGTINESGTVFPLGGSVTVQYTFTEDGNGISHNVDYSDGGAASGSGFSLAEK